MDATKEDLLSFNPIPLLSLSGGLTSAGFMDLSLNKQFTLVYGPASNAFALIDNSTQQISITTSSLPDSTQSAFIATNNQRIYAAVPNAPITGQSPGAVIVLNTTSGAIIATLPIPGVRSIVQAPFGERILAFSDNSDAVVVIDPGKIGTSQDPRTIISGFDHPVWAVFADIGPDQAFILECGLQCGGTASAVTLLDLTTNTTGTRIPVPAATIGVLQGGLLVVAGTPPGTACDSSTQAATCGVVTIIDRVQLQVIASKSITDGYHNRIAAAADGRVFIGSHDCSSFTMGSEKRGCLSIVNTNGAHVTVPPAVGSVTGISPVPGRSATYVVQDGEVAIYDTTTDKLLPGHQRNIVGQVVDVRVVDKAP